MAKLPGWIALWLGVSAASLGAQPAREFETVSIKPYAPSGPPFEACNDHSGPVQLNLVGCTLKALVRMAYKLKDYQLQMKGPQWMGNDPYVIQARATQPAGRPERMQMLQPLLAQRFQVKVHWETRDAPVYLLKVAGHGLKLKPADKVDHCGEVFFRPGTVKADCATVDDIGEILESILTEHPVINDTGIGKDQRYQIDLEYTAADDASNGAAVVAALPEQVGLMVKAGKAAVKMLVVDSAQRPSGN